MKIVYSWLKDFVDIEIPAEDLADSLNCAKIEVASIYTQKIPAGIKVARVLDVQKHPNADKLHVCSVDAGTGSPLQIVCGAPNVTKDMVVPLATEGTVIGDITIKKAKLRGVESNGMLCSESELGLSDDHSGLMRLPEHVKIGEEVSTYYPDEAVLEIEITPDRGDCLSMLGVAREVAARYGLQLKQTAKNPLENEKESIENHIKVTINDPSACPRYMGRLIKGVKIAPSPEWLQRRLTLAGIRPINNVVDVTNYILIHFGQPMHAFDYSQIQGKEIIVKKAGAPTTFKTLDNIDRNLKEDDLLIWDGARPVALAGIMGGAGSEIADTTTDVFLECAFFNPVTVRKTSKRLGLSTDSSYRFERGVDPGTGLQDALETAAEMIRELAGGVIVKGRIDNYPVEIQPKKINIRSEKTSRILGITFTDDQIISSLTSLGITCTKKSTGIECIIPLYRHDIALEEDLIEEVGRLYGYDNIPLTESAMVSLNNVSLHRENITDKIREILAYSGLNEIVTNSMKSEKILHLLTPDKKPVMVMNPLNPEMSAMRTTLAANFLETLVHNINHKNSNNRYFEVGKTFWYNGENSVEEHDTLGILLQGSIWNAGWNVTPTPVDFYVLKGLIQNFAFQMGLGTIGFSNVSGEKNPIFDNNLVQLKDKNELIQGRIGKISDLACKHYDIKQPVYYAEIDISKLFTESVPKPVYHALPKFPALERDFCFVMGESVVSNQIEREIYKISNLVEKVTPFDVYKGEKLGAGKKSIAFNVTLRSSDKTLTDKDAEGIHSSIIETMKTKYSAVLRS